MSELFRRCLLSFMAVLLVVGVAAPSGAQATASAVSAAGSQPSSPQTPVQPASPAPSGSSTKPAVSVLTPAGPPHLMKTRMAGLQHGAPAVAASGNASFPALSGAKNLVSHGGVVIKTRRVFTIFWLPSSTSVSPGFQSRINQFFNAVGGSQLDLAMRQYDDTSGVTTQAVKLAGTWVDTRAYTDAGGHDGSASNPLSDFDIRDEVSHAISSNSSFQNQCCFDFYFVFTGHGVHSCSSSGNCSNAQYCGYHNAAIVSGGAQGWVEYANMPYDEDGGCSITSGGVSPSGNPAADDEVSVASHELFEGLTDPYPPGNCCPSAWWVNATLNGQSGNQEVGDECNFVAGPTLPDGSDVNLNGVPFIVQGEYDNRSSQCTLPNGPPVVNSVAPSSGSCQTKVDIKGDQLADDAQVFFNGVASTNVTRDTFFHLTATAPQFPTGTVADVTVHTSEGTSPVTSSDRFTYGPAAPQSTASRSPAANDNGWNNSATTVEVNATDDGCGTGVAYIVYSASGAQSIPSTKVTGTHASVPITAQGITTVSYYAVDNLGNVESPGNTITVRIDETPPSITAADPFRGPDSNGWYNHPITFGFSGTDSLSGIDHCSTVTYSGPDTSSFKVTGTCTDRAGNVSAPGTFGTYKYDATPPTVTGSALSRQTDHNGWYNHPVDVAYSGTDNLSGIDHCATITYSGPDSASASVLGTCTDVAGNTSAPVRSATFKYDSQPPTQVHAVPSRAADHNGWYNHAVDFTYAGVDDVSGIDTCTSTSYSGPDSKTATVSGTCTDVAGNTSAAVPYTFEYDSTPPTAAINGGAIQLQIAGTPLTGTGADNLSGVDSVTVSFYDVLGLLGTVTRPATCTSGCGTTSATWSVDTSGLFGLYTVTATPTDVAGNVGQPSPPVLLDLVL